MSNKKNMKHINGAAINNKEAAAWANEIKQG
jgi:hypothetical protein